MGSKNISDSIKTTKPSRLSPAPPPWEVLSLMGRYLDPNTIAISSCVSKQWSVCFSSDHLWEPLCTARFSSLLSLHHHPTSSPSIPYRRLYSVGHAADRRCHWRQYNKPSLSLDNLLFAVGLYTPHRGSGGGFHQIQTMVIRGQELELNPHGMFSFEMKVETRQDHDDVSLAVGGRDGWWLDLVGPLRMTWNVVLDGWKEVFTVMDEEDNGRRRSRLPVAAGPGGWISKELPGPGCCLSGKGSGLVANMRVQIRDEVEEGGNDVVDPDCRGCLRCNRRVAVEKVRVEILNMNSWSELSLDDGLLYLQHFLC